jgi:hypothetical protein
VRSSILAIVLGCGLAAQASAQPQLDGYASLFLDRLPNVPAPATELRARLFVEHTWRTTEVLTLTASGFVEGLVADRGGARRDAHARPHEIVADLVFDRMDLRLGLGRVVWGRLDELQPSDVVNPLDVARFFFEGRSEARLPVPLVRARAFFDDDTMLEGVYVPVFRSGRYDQLDEPTAPFNLESGIVTCLAIEICPPPTIERREPERSLESAQGGLRFSATTRRVDWSVELYRGFRPFGIIDRVGPKLVKAFPRFTMIAGDFESVYGRWAFRGEVAAFVDDPASGGSSLDAGAGLDRKAGEYRVNGSILVHDDGNADAAVTFIASADRSFRRDRYRTRTFAVVNATEGSSFIRTIATISLRDNVELEGSVGWFFGKSDEASTLRQAQGRPEPSRGTTGSASPRAQPRGDAIGRFADRDFLYARLKVYL